MTVTSRQNENKIQYTGTSFCQCSCLRVFTNLYYLGCPSWYNLCIVSFSCFFNFGLHTQLFDHIHSRLLVGCKTIHFCRLMTSKSVVMCPWVCLRAHAQGHNNSARLLHSIVMDWAPHVSGVFIFRVQSVAQVIPGIKGYEWITTAFLPPYHRLTHSSPLLEWRQIEMQSLPFDSFCTGDWALSVCSNLTRFMSKNRIWILTIRNPNWYDLSFFQSTYLKSSVYNRAVIRILSVSILTL